MRALARNWGWIAATLALAAAVHLASLWALPRMIMIRTMSMVARNGGMNAMGHGRRPDAQSRGVVRPSPDLLYSTCVFDLDAANGALRVHASGMPKTYWSVSAFDSATNNFFVENDRKAGDAVDFVIVAPGVLVDTKLPVVTAPGTMGLVLFRTLINDETKLAEIDRARRSATCEPFGGAG
jgi:uncharacterized membrane protein